nr:alpha/beta hydrolase [Peribacillus simplex]
MKKKSIITRVLTVIAICLVLSATIVASKTGVGFASKSKTVAHTPDMSNGADNFYKSKKVNMQEVSFKNQYKMKVAGNLFIPKGLKKNTKNPAIIVGHPMGAVKEQSANLYAQKRDSLLCPWICLSGERVRGSLGTLFRQISMPKISVLR